MTSHAQQEKIVKRACADYLNKPDIALADKQHLTTRDAPARGPVWISRTSFKAPCELDIRDALHRACTTSGNPSQEIPPSSQIPLKDVGVEFIGIRKGVDPSTPEPTMLEGRKLEMLQDSCENDFTILYLHGGGM